MQSEKSFQEKEKEKERERERESQRDGEREKRGEYKTGTELSGVTRTRVLC